MRTPEKITNLGLRCCPDLTHADVTVCKSSINFDNMGGKHFPFRESQTAARSTVSNAHFRSTKAVRERLLKLYHILYCIAVLRTTIPSSFKLIRPSIKLNCLVTLTFDLLTWRPAFIARHMIIHSTKCDNCIEYPFSSYECFNLTVLVTCVLYHVTEMGQKSHVFGILDLDLFLDRTVVL